MNNNKDHEGEGLVQCSKCEGLCGYSCECGEGKVTCDLCHGEGEIAARTQPPASEGPVTDAMIEAGIRQLKCDEFCICDDLVRRIYLAMRQAQPAADVRHD